MNRFSAENFPKILSVVSQIQEVGKKHSATPGQVTLAWILAQGNDFLVIPGTKKIKVSGEYRRRYSIVLETHQVLIYDIVPRRKCWCCGSPFERG